MGCELFRLLMGQCVVRNAGATARRIKDSAVIAAHHSRTVVRNVGQTIRQENVPPLSSTILAITTGLARLAGWRCIMRCSRKPPTRGGNR